MVPAISQVMARRQFGEESYPEAIAFMAAFPVFRELSEAVLVHGMLEPDIPLNEQPETVLTGSFSGEVYIKNKYGRPWYEIYNGTKPVVADTVPPLMWDEARVWLKRRLME